MTEPFWNRDIAFMLAFVPAQILTILIVAELIGRRDNVRGRG
jgi:hypothetical protein